MRASAPRLWFISLIAGALLCLNDRLAPLRLKSMKLDGFSSEIEQALRDWSEPFLAFHPVWLLARGELRSLERAFPMKIKTQWEPLRGRLHLTAIPAKSALRLVWHHTEYMAAEDGSVWPTELWSKCLNASIPLLPCLNVASSFPLLEEGSANSKARLKVPLQWLMFVLRAPLLLEGLKVTSLQLLRRGGEDLISCTITNETTAKRTTFLGRTAGLEKSLLVVRELLSAGSAEIIAIDATYEDKIIIKREMPQGGGGVQKDNEDEHE